MNKVQSEAPLFQATIDAHFKKNINAIKKTKKIQIVIILKLKVIKSLLF